MRPLILALLGGAAILDLATLLLVLAVLLLGATAVAWALAATVYLLAWCCERLAAFLIRRHHR